MFTLTAITRLRYSPNCSNCYLLNGYVCNNSTGVVHKYSSSDRFSDRFKIHLAVQAHHTFFFFEFVPNLIIVFVLFKHFFHQKRSYLTKHEVLMLFTAQCLGSRYMHLSTRLLNRPHWQAAASLMCLQSIDISEVSIWGHSPG